jgi:predicted N-acetyltransferase YhbS
MTKPDFLQSKLKVRVNDLRMRTARKEDTDALVRLINDAFRPERFFIDGERTDATHIGELMTKGTFLLAEDGGELVGCVYVEPRDEHWYLGLLSVEPGRQGLGLGAFLMRAAEDHSRAAGATAMDLQIVNLRTELPGFYRRCGYEETGTAPLRPEMQVKQPCHFIVMSKKLG